MTDDLPFGPSGPGMQPGRPLSGLTILVIEDSRFAADGLRLLCLRSGARFRRADCLASARRHLAGYRPSVAIVDPGLPDGSGLDLIALLAADRPRTVAVLAASGDPGMAAACRDAGADGFLEKPVAGLAAFQAAVLAALARPLPGPRAVEAGAEAPPADTLALRDDLARAAALLDPANGATGDRAEPYAAQFVGSLAHSAGDAALEAAARAAARGASAAVLRGLVRQRLDGATPAF